MQANFIVQSISNIVPPQARQSAVQIASTMVYSWEMVIPWYANERLMKELHMKGRMIIPHDMQLIMAALTLLAQRKVSLVEAKGMREGIPNSNPKWYMLDTSEWYWLSPWAHVLFPENVQPAYFVKLPRSRLCSRFWSSPLSMAWNKLNKLCKLPTRSQRINGTLCTLFFAWKARGINDYIVYDGKYNPSTSKPIFLAPDSVERTWRWNWSFRDPVPTRPPMWASRASGFKVYSNSDMV